MVKNPLAMRETWVRSLGWENPLEEGMTEEPGGLQSKGLQRVRQDSDKARKFKVV